VPRAWQVCLGGLLVAVLSLLAIAAAARGELSSAGNLLVGFKGAITPKALPRSSRAPVAVSFAATVRTLSSQRPPALGRITIRVNRAGRLDARGLPLCTRAQIQAFSSADALAACGPALIGSGRFDAVLALPEQAAFPSRGRVLAFNSRLDGRPAILAHVYGSEPVPISRLIVFRIRPGAGTYATVLSASLPRSLNQSGYLTHFSLSLHRTFSYRGKRRSYLSAACEAPPGFPGAVFAFARASLAFADGRTLSATLTRSCRVRAETGTEVTSFR
jgi:hypothetical protein